ncbi:MAG: hypothetical protein ACRDCA_12410 [Serratia sp. (in: enterobacteria)]|uniref:hypothetical protein n=1 Tax=Serratia sp. (in: enterobacteria) TaxID=616 RepID=UPI003F357C81
MPDTSDFQIVTINVTQTIGAIPSTLQKTAALVSSGETTLEAGTSQLITQASDLKDILKATGTASITAMTESFFAQGQNQAVYIYETGSTEAVAAIANLKEYIDDPELRFYAYTVPASWDGIASFISLAAAHETTTSMLYFFVDIDEDDGKNPYEGTKSVIVTRKSDDATISNSAAFMWNLVSADPSEINKVPPMAFRFMFGVIPFAKRKSVKTLLTNGYINYIGVGAEGGISNKVLFNGMSSDGNDLTYWYSVDWIQINAHLALANEIINGSNNPINPLYFNQDGIERLQLRAQSVFNSGVSYGLVNGNPTVNAVGFRQYVKNNPNDYAIGRYAGLSAEYTPMRGFVKIVFNINVTMQLP